MTHFLKIKLSILNTYLVYTDVYMPECEHMHAVCAAEVRRRIWIPWNWSYKHVRATTWTLETKF